MSIQIDVDLIFVHVPKAGGTAIRAALSSHWGAGLYADYSDRPGDPTAPMHAERERFLSQPHEDALKGRRAVIGHFWIKKYNRVRSDLRATILREPISRAISHYHYWMATEAPNNSIWRLVRESNMGFLEFAGLPSIRWFYTRMLFPDGDMSRFDYIGDYADLARDWDTTLRRLGVTSPRIVEHDTAVMSAGYRSNVEDVLSDQKAMSALCANFADDIRFFERWLRR